MTYYFQLLNTNVKNFWSNKTVFGGGVVLIAPDGSHMLFKCNFVRKLDDVDGSVFKIELEPDEFNKYVYNEHLRITLANMVNSSNYRRITWTQLHNSDDFDDDKESYHYYHFAVNLKEQLILTGDEQERVKSIKIADIFKNNSTTIEIPVFNEGIMFRRPECIIYHMYSVKIPDKYISSSLLEKDSFTKVLYVSNNIKESKGCIAVTMYRSINGPKGLKDSMGLEERRTSLKNFWQPEAKPWDWINTAPVNTIPECNITIDIPKDFIPPYSVADSKINPLEVFKEMSMFESDKKVRIPEIKEVIFNGPATVVYWKDGTKTTVKYGNYEAFYDKEKAVAMCFLKKMFKPSIKSHWLDVINDAIKAADDKVAKVEADKAEKARIKAENIAKAEEARKKKAEKKAAAFKEEIKTLEKKENDSGKDLFKTVQKENNKVVLNKNGGVKIDQDLFLECVKENLTIDEIAEMNSWSKSAVARMYYKVTGKRPEKKNNTYSELDELFEKGVSVDAAARRTGFAKNIVAMRYAKLQNKKN